MLNSIISNNPYSDKYSKTPLCYMLRCYTSFANVPYRYLWAWFVHKLGN